MAEKKFIFLTNDDGYAAKGLHELISILRPYGRLLVVAPEVGQSGMSHAITMVRPLNLRKISEEDDVTLYACNGTPVDCVKIAFDYLLMGQPLPNLVFSGINHGSNSAINVLYSGTIAGAVEGSFYQIPAFGVSLLDYSADADFSPVRHFLPRIIDKVLQGDVTLPMCLNINVPNLPVSEIRGILPCRQSRGYWLENFECRLDPRGNDYYWLSGNFVNSEPEATDTDEWALSNGYVSIVPVQVDLTNYEQLHSMQNWNF